MTAATAAARERRLVGPISDFFFARPQLLTLLLLLPPLLWIGIVYIGSLFALLLQSFYSLDDFSGVIVHKLTLATYWQLFEEANVLVSSTATSQFGQDTLQKWRDEVTVTILRL